MQRWRPALLRAGPLGSLIWEKDVSGGITFCSSAEGRHCVLFLCPRVIVGVLAYPYILRLEEL